MHTAHQPNEHASISATIADARVFAHLLFQRQTEE
jgi:succinyl-diaminopimelate desuccinylase